MIDNKYSNWVIVSALLQWFLFQLSSKYFTDCYNPFDSSSFSYDYGQTAPECGVARQATPLKTWIIAINTPPFFLTTFCFNSVQYPHENISS